MSQIPEGATHRSQGHYYKKEGPSWMLHGSASQWMETACLWKWLDENAEPLTPAWTGEGLPPVGTVCEYNDNCGGQWVKVEVRYVSEFTFLLKFFGDDGDCEGAFSPAEVRFRPIRTPEQIAAEERHQVLLEMARIEPALTTCMAGKLYDAGCRMPGKGAKA